MVSRKLQQSKHKYSLFFPNALIEAIGWEKGDEIDVKLGKGKTIELKKK